LPTLFGFVGFIEVGAGRGNRTLVCSLEGCRSTIELHPHRTPQILLRNLALSIRQR
jgi:hypothetical protein